MKGLYKKARAGEIKNFTGISDPYEAPENPDLDINTGNLTLEQSVDYVLKRMFDDGVLVDNHQVRITPALYETPTEEQVHEYNNLPSIDINVEQAEYI